MDESKEEINYTVFSTDSFFIRLKTETLDDLREKNWKWEKRMLWIQKHMRVNAFIKKGVFDEESEEFLTAIFEDESQGKLEVSQ